VSRSKKKLCDLKSGQISRRKVLEVCRQRSKRNGRPCLGIANACRLVDSDLPLPPQRENSKFISG